MGVGNATTGERDYVGEYSHQLDTRKRVAIPSDWRAEGDDANYYMAWPHPDGCIAVYPPRMQREFLRVAEGIKQSDLRGQKLLRQFFGKGHKFGCDRQGRVLVPEALIEHAGIGKGVVLVGLGNNFQVWSAERHSATEAEEFNLIEAMKDLGL